LAWGTPSTVGQVWNLLLHSGGNANASSRWGPTAWPCVARRSCCDGGSSRRSEPYTTACRNTIRPSRLCIWTPATTIRRVGRSWVTAGWSARSPSWGAGSGLGRSPVGDRAHPRLSEPVRQAALVHRARQDRGGVLAGMASAIIVCGRLPSRAWTHAAGKAALAAAHDQPTGAGRKRQRTRCPSGVQACRDDQHQTDESRFSW
jgi:hypothetical protein